MRVILIIIYLCCFKANLVNANFAEMKLDVPAEQQKQLIDYVQLMAKWNSVYNLTSARLVLGNAGNPVAVKSDELNKMPKGQPIGVYSGLLVDAESNRPMGTLAVEVAAAAKR